MTPPSILDALDDANLLGAGFRDAGSWSRWRIALAALFGLPMTAEEAAIYTEHTGGTTPPATPAREGWFIVGRRGGKSRIAAAVAVYLATFKDYTALLAPGERGTLPIIAADRQQARTVFRYVAGLLDGSPILARFIDRQTTDAIDLSNNITIEVHTASFRAVRGYTVVGAVLDEVAFWRSEDSANPDTEILAALRPAMATVPGAVLLAISSPYARRGVLWDAYRRHYAHESDILVWKAPTRTMNPTVPQRVVDDALGDDEAGARAEYLAEFRTDVEAFITRELLDAATILGRHGLPPVRRTTYTAFVDPSGGAQDAFSLAIAHQETQGGREVSILDHLSARRPPFSPEQVVEEFSATLAAYDVQRVVGDRYGGEWPREQFRKHGVAYEASERTKSDLYRELLPLLTSGRVELLDHPKLATELLGLERRTARGGRDSIDHGPGGHDDLANAAAGALVLASAAPTATMLFCDEPGGDVLEEAKSAYLQQIKQTRPDWFYRPDPDLVCGTCSAFSDGLCTLRGLLVEASMLKCDAYDPVPERGF